MSLNKLGRYELVRVLGKGAMGIVYEGRDPNLHRRVAIKTVKVENLSQVAAAEYERRFRTEARSAARLQHPNIVSVYDSDRDGGVAFLVMEYVHGEDLKHSLDKGVRYSLDQSLVIIRDLLCALDYAHKQGIIHRDIKPANLMIDAGGRLKLTDFGVARIQDSGDATRTQGGMLGTLKYMAPEQVQGRTSDARTDLFSVGVVLYQLLTGMRPFDGENDFSIVHQITSHHPPPPRSINPRLPPALDTVVACALAKSADQRFASAAEFAAALDSAMEQAEGQMTLPPAGSYQRMPATEARSSAEISTIGSGGSLSSAVAQEVELVYWKDIKDSSDAEAIQAFLARFPAGIYEDLARRRLLKLANGSRVETEQGGGLSQPFQFAPLHPTGPGTSTRPAWARKRWVALMSIIGVLVVLGVAACEMIAGSAPPVADVPVVATIGAQTAPGLVPAAGAVAMGTGEAGSPEAAGNSGETRRTTTAEPPRSAPARAPLARDRPQVAAAAPIAAGARAVQACRDKMIFSREYCLSQACAKPESRGHPLCVRWRQDKRLRDDSKAGQGPQ